MRLDEWQKYIEAQFLDDEALPKDALTVKPVHVAVNETAGVEVPLVVTPLVNASVQAEIEPEPAVPAGQCLPTEAPPAQLPEPAERVSATSVPTDHLYVDTPLDFGDVPDPDIDIPAFDSYLPASHRAGRQESMGPVIVSAPEPTLNSSEVARSNPTDVVDESHPASPPEILPESAPEAIPPASIAARRAPRSRVRHARNVRPEHVPSGLSVGELWATVPKHVQTLLSLERLEEEQEVAQFSYKRPFQEKRRELIARLLDPILSLEDTARLLNVCPTTVRRYTNKGILTYYRKEPDRSGRNDVSPSDSNNSINALKETRQRRFRLSDILAFLETQQAALEEDRQGENTATASLRNRRTRSTHPPQGRATCADDKDAADTLQPAKD